MKVIKSKLKYKSAHSIVGMSKYILPQNQFKTIMNPGFTTKKTGIPMFRFVDSCSSYTAWFFEEQVLFHSLVDFVSTNKYIFIFAYKSLVLLNLATSYFQFR